MEQPITSCAFNATGAHFFGTIPGKQQIASILRKYLKFGNLANFGSLTQLVGLVVQLTQPLERPNLRYCGSGLSKLVLGTNS